MLDMLHCITKIVKDTFVKTIKENFISNKTHIKFVIPRNNAGFSTKQ